MQMLRYMMSDGAVPMPKVAKKYARNDRVLVGGEINKPGTVIRARDSEYTVRFDNGTRCHVRAEMLSIVAPFPRPKKIRRSIPPPPAYEEEIPLSRHG